MLHRRILTLVICLGLASTLLGDIPLAAANSSGRQATNQKLQMVLVMDVSLSMSWSMLPQDKSTLPQDLIVMSERLQQIESDPDYPRLYEAAEKINADPQVAAASDLYYKERDAEEDWLKGRGFGELLQIEARLQEKLDELGCFVYWGADSIIFFAENLADAERLIVEHDCQYVSIGEESWSQIREILAFMDDAEYQAIHKRVVDAWQAYQEIRSQVGKEVFVEYDHFLAETGHDELLDQINKRAEQIGIPSKLELAQLAAQNLVDLTRLDTKASGRLTRMGLVEFYYEGRVVQPFTEDMDVMEEAIQGLQFKPSTNIGDGLLKALDEIAAHGEAGLESTIILLSDGKTAAGLTSDQILEQIPAKAREQKTRICSVAFGVTETDIDRRLLQGLADETGGKYLFARSADELLSFFVACRQGSVSSAVQQFTGLVQHGQTADAGRLDVAQNTGLISFTLVYLSGKLDLELVDPSGKVVNADYPGVTIQHSENVAYVTVQNPLPSQWVVRVRGQEVPANGSIYNVFVGTESRPSPTLTPTAAPAPPLAPSTLQLAVPPLILGILVLAAAVFVFLIVFLFLEKREISITPGIMVGAGGFFGIVLVAVALLVGMVVVVGKNEGKSPLSIPILDSLLSTATPTLTATFTPSPTPTVTLTFTPTPSSTPTPLPTATLTPIALDAGNGSQITLVGRPIYNDMGVEFLAISPDGRLAASDGWYYLPGPDQGGVTSVNLWLVLPDTLVPYGMLVGETDDDIEAAVFSPDGRLLAHGTERGIILLWDLESQTVVRRLEGHSDSVTGLSFSPDGSLLASSARDSSVKIWNVSEGVARRTIPYGFETYSVAFSPDGQHLAVGSRELRKLLTMYRVSDGKLVQTFSGHQDTVVNVSFSPDGQYLASGDLDNLVFLWEASTGKRVAILRGHTDRIRKIAFSPNGELLASSARDKTAKVWRIPDGSLLATLTGFADVTDGIVFSPDGSLLLVGSWDNYIRLWGIRP